MNYVRHISRKTISPRLGYVHVRDESMNLILDVMDILSVPIYCFRVMQGYIILYIIYTYVLIEKRIELLRRYIGIYEILILTIWPLYVHRINRTI